MNSKPSHPDAPLFWDRKEVSEKLGLSLRMIDKLVAMDAIPSRKIGGLRKFPVQPVIAWSQQTDSTKGDAT